MPSITTREDGSCLWLAESVSVVQQQEMYPANMDQACVFGASIICVDIPIRFFTSKKDFSIQDNNVFLASSLSLSFGVMVRCPFMYRKELADP